MTTFKALNGKLVEQATMVKELCLRGIYPCTVAGNKRCECQEYNVHIASLRTFTATFPLIEGKEYVEGKDFELQWQYLTINNEWLDCLATEYTDVSFYTRRIIAVAIPAEKERGVTIVYGGYEVLKPISERINYFTNNHHKYEANELHDALNVIMRLVPPSSFAPTPPVQGVEERAKDMGDYWGDQWVNMAELCRSQEKEIERLKNLLHDQFTRRHQEAQLAEANIKRAWIIYSKSNNL